MVDLLGYSCVRIGARICFLQFQYSIAKLRQLVVHVENVIAIRVMAPMWLL